MKLIPLLVVAAVLSQGVGSAQTPERVPPDAQPTAVGKSPEMPATTAKPARARATTNAIGIKLTITVSKYQGEKKVSSTPFVVSLADNNSWNLIRAGARVPIPRRAMDTGPVSYNYEQVGLSIDSRAFSLPNGTFQVETKASDASVVATDAAASASFDAPVIRNISVASTTVMKDGQTTQLSSATDPITGLVMRVDVTLNVAK